jgi:hypothetical protein
MRKSFGMKFRKHNKYSKLKIMKMEYRQCHAERYDRREPNGIYGNLLIVHFVPK